MVGKSILAWIVSHDRTVDLLARQAGLDTDTLVGLITGEFSSDAQDLVALERAMDLRDGELRRVVASKVYDRESADALRCFTVREVAQRMRVSEDVVRQEMAGGILPYITVGVRGYRIPWAALEHRLSCWRTDTA